MDDGLRVLPHHIEAEEGLIACCLLDGGVSLSMSLAMGIGPEDFYRGAHALIWEALAAMDGVPDEIRLRDALERSGDLVSVGGIEAIYAIQNRVQTSGHARYFADIVLGRSRLRRLIRACRLAAERAYDQSDDAAEIASGLEGELRRVLDDDAGNAEGPRSSEEIVEACRKDLAKRLENPDGALARVQAPLADLARVLPGGGFNPGQLVVLAARPSVGKSALAMNIAEQAAVRDGVPVLVFSLEMGAGELIDRAACSMARVDGKAVRDGELEAHEHGAVNRAYKKLADAPLRIDATSSLAVPQLRARALREAERLKRNGNSLGLVVVDYLQLLSTPSAGGRQQSTREQIVSEMSRAMKILAGEIGVPVLLLSQLNRANERDNREPRLSDLRESGSIEQDADIVLLLHRLPPLSDDDGCPDPDIDTIKILHAKVRGGPVGFILSRFRRSSTRFENAARTPVLPPPSRQPDQNEFMDGKL